MQRIAIIGSSGSGKSYLAQQLGEHFELPVIDLDNVILDDHYQEPPPDVYRSKVQTEADKERWIIEGVYPKVGDIVWPAADAVIWLNLPFDATRKQYTHREKQTGKPGPFPDVSIHEKEYARLAKLYPELLGELAINKLVTVTDPQYTLEAILSEL